MVYLNKQSCELKFENWRAEFQLFEQLSRKNVSVNKFMFDDFSAVCYQTLFSECCLVVKFDWSHIVTFILPCFLFFSPAEVCNQYQSYNFSSNCFKLYSRQKRSNFTQGRGHFPIFLAGLWSSPLATLDHFRPKYLFFVFFRSNFRPKYVIFNIHF